MAKAFCPKNAFTTMMTSNSASSLPPLLSQAAVPLRSPRTSIILAERARQRRWARRQRRQGRTRWAARFAVFDRCPFDSIRQHTGPCLVFVGPMPFVYALQSW